MSVEAPLEPNPAALAFLQTRRSTPPRMLGQRVPDQTALTGMLQVAARVPDHGKLEPWRFQVLAAPACQRLGRLANQIGASRQVDAARLEKTVAGFANAGLIIAVVFAPQKSDKVPLSEQRASAAAVCVSLVNAALASGWGAAWLTGWPATDPEFLADGLGVLAPMEVVGFVHIGNALRTPPDRPRPDMARITTWIDA